MFKEISQTSNKITHKVVFERLKYNADFAKRFIIKLQEKNIDLDRRLQCYAEDEQERIIAKLPNLIGKNLSFDEIMEIVIDGLKPYSNVNPNWNKVIFDDAAKFCQTFCAIVDEISKDGVNNMQVIKGLIFSKPDNTTYGPLWYTAMGFLMGVGASYCYSRYNNHL